MAASITFIGTGEAFDPDRPNTSVLYQGARSILLDCGYRVPHAFWAHHRDPDLLDAIYISHIHADHSFGLPPLLLWMRTHGRTRPITIFGAGQNFEAWLMGVLSLAYPGSFDPAKCFPIQAVVIEPGTPTEFGPLRLQTATSTHAVQNHSLRIEEAGFSTCYSGDGSPTEATASLFEGADVLIHECFTATSAATGHGTAADLIPLAERLHIGTLCLVHLSTDDLEAVPAFVAGYEGDMPVHVVEAGDQLDLVSHQSP
jgi:ribonuclease Z